MHLRQIGSKLGVWAEAGSTYSDLDGDEQIYAPYLDADLYLVPAATAAAATAGRATGGSASDGVGGDDYDAVTFGTLGAPAAGGGGMSPDYGELHHYGVPDSAV